jgi:hypothetical protein
MRADDPINGLRSRFRECASEVDGAKSVECTGWKSTAIAAHLAAHSRMPGITAFDVTRRMRQTKLHGDVVDNGSRKQL